MPKTFESPLLTIQYTVVRRFIHNFVQQQETNHYTLALTETTIISNTRHFELARLMDISYKPFTNGQGFLYLHADEGLFSFLISTDPTHFIQTCHKLIRN